MTVKELLRYAMIETKKNNAPNLLIEDYNYFINKAIQQKINEVYNFYNADQQRTDDLRVIKAFSKIDVNENNILIDEDDNVGKIFEVQLPGDYLHIVACDIQFKLLHSWQCYEKDQKWRNSAIRGTGELNSSVINNAYFRPSYRTPYYYIINNSFSNSSWRNYIYILEYTDSDFNDIPKNRMRGSTLDIIYRSLKLEEKGKVDTAYKKRLNEELPTDTSEISAIVRADLITSDTPDIAKEKINSAYNNVLLQIRCGKCDVFQPVAVFIDYLKTPQFVRLTQKQFDQDVDTSQVLEFPEYFCQEILNKLVTLLLENYSDPRLPSNNAINQTIAPPAGVQQQGQGSRK